MTTADFRTDAGHATITRLVAAALRFQKPPAEILTGLLKLMEAQSPDLLGSILYFDPTQKKLLHGAAPGLPEEYVRQVDGVVIGDCVGSCGTAAYRKTRVYVDNIATDPLWKDFPVLREIAHRHGLTSCWSNPILGPDDQLLGTLAVYRRVHGSPSEQHVRLMDLATDLAEAVLTRHMEDADRRLRDHAIVSSSNGIVIVDAQAEDQPIVYCNPAFEKLTGYRRDEILGRNCRLLQRDDRDQPGLHRIRTAIRQHREVTARIRNYRKDGSLIWLELHISPVRDATGRVTHFVGFQNDVTEQQQTELALRRSEEKFRHLCAHAPIGILMNSVAGECRYVNSAGLKVLQRNESEILGAGWKDAIHPMDRERVLRQWAYATQHGRAFRSEFRFQAADGREIWVDGAASSQLDNNGSITGYVGTIQDITARKQAEERLRLTQFSVDSCSAAILWSRPDGSLFFVNRAAVQQFGYTREELLKMRLQDFAPTDSGDAWNEHWAAISQSRTKTFECCFLCKDGRVVPVEVTTNLLSYEHRTFLLAFVTDISSRKAAEEQLRLLNSSLEERVQERTRELRQANEDLDAYARSVAHDLRAPLRAMRAFATALFEDYPNQLDDEGKSYAEYIVSAGEQMDELIRDLLEYSRIGTDRMSRDPQDLDEIVAAAVRQLCAQVNATQASVQIDRPLGVVTGSRSALIQMVVNLLSNAMKFVQRNTQPVIHVASQEHAGRLRLWIQDNGIGIPEEDQERIFRVFERLHGMETFPGTGVGLAIVRRTAESLGADFGVESVPGKGSRFWIEFPQAEQSA